MKWIFRDAVALIFAGVGILLLIVAFHFNVNPVDSGAVRGGLQHHPSLFVPLVVATIPAMFVGMLTLALISGTADHSIGYFAGAFVGQFLIYFMIGLAISGIVKRIRRKTTQSPNLQIHPVAGKPGSG